MTSEPPTTPSVMPEWARDMTDVHVHSAPSVMPRHQVDARAVAEQRAMGFTLSVLKAHEGFTAERATLAGEGALGGVVLNSPVGGANPDAVEVAARMGGRIVWMPTVSAVNHIAHQRASALKVHRKFELRAVEVVTDGRLAAGWHEVLEVVAHHDLLLASGHLAMAETLLLFREATRLGVRRLLVNHPQMAFLGWDDQAAQELRALGASIELSILPDILDAHSMTSLRLSVSYPVELQVFGGDFGHAHYPTAASALPSWLVQLADRVGEEAAKNIMSINGRRLVLPA